MKIIDKIHTVIALIVKYFLVARDFLVTTFHPYMPAVYIFSIIISGVLLWFTIYCISGSGWVKSKIIEKYMDMHGIGDVGKYRQLKAWKNVIKRMKTDEPSNWKIAVMEADTLMDEIFKASGYRATTPDERFKQVTPEGLSNIDQVMEAHQIRNRIMREKDFVLTKEEALRVLRIYQHAFQEDGLLD